MAIAAGQRGLASDLLVEHNADGTHDLPDGADVAWFKPNVGPTSTRSQHGKYPSVLLDAGAETALFSVRVPAKYVSLGTVYVVIIPTTTGTFDWTCNADSGACGEDEALNSDTDTADGQAATDDQILCLDVSAAFNGLGLVAGDHIGVEFVLDVLTTTTELHVIGLAFGYVGSR